MPLDDLFNQYFGPHPHEAEEISALPSVLDGVKIFVDVGASLGQYARAVDQALVGATIYCIEPDPERAQRLRGLISEWARNSDNQFTIIEAALDETSGNAEFYVSADQSTSGALFPLDKFAHNVLSTSVKTMSLDDLFAHVAVDFIKLDVEGAEYRVLRGGRRLLVERRPRILLEIAPWGDIAHGYRPSDVVKFLGDLGYSVTILANHYMFVPSRSGVLSPMKIRALAYILDRPRLKYVARFIFSMGRTFH